MSCNNETKRILAVTIYLLALLGRVSSKEFSSKSSFTLRNGQVHFDVGYIRGPGSIDLGGLTFHSEAETNMDTAVDIAVFPLPNEKRLYQKTFKNLGNDHDCDWNQLGLGVPKGIHSDSVELCCTAEVIRNGDCKEQEYGRLIVADHIQLRSVNIPKSDSSIPYYSVTPNQRIVNVTGSGLYGIIYAFCGREKKFSSTSEPIEAISTSFQSIQTTGKAAWKSKHGYLPGELYNFMNFYVLITIAYLILAAWLLYHISNKDNNYWIIAAVLAGTVEMITRSAEFYQWNSTGSRKIFGIWTGIILCAYKEGLTRCIALLVLQDSDTKKIKFSNLRYVTICLYVYIYIGSLMMANILILVTVEFADRLTIMQFEKFIDLIKLFDPYMKMILDICFTMLLLYLFANKIAITWYTTNKGYQINKKNRLFANLQILYIIVLILVTTLYILSRLDHYTGGIISVKHAWAKDAAYEVLYFIVLAGISSICWNYNTSKIDENGNVSLRMNLLSTYTLVGEDNDEQECVNVSESGIQLC